MVLDELRHPVILARNSVLLNFGAVDYEATLYINGGQAGFNRGGYYAIR